MACVRGACTCVCSFWGESVCKSMVLVVHAMKTKERKQNHCKYCLVKWRRLKTYKPSVHQSCLHTCTCKATDYMILKTTNCRTLMS